MIDTVQMIMMAIPPPPNLAMYCKQHGIVHLYGDQCSSNSCKLIKEGCVFKLSNDKCVLRAFHQRAFHQMLKLEKPQSKLGQNPWVRIAMCTMGMCGREMMSPSSTYRSQILAFSSSNLRAIRPICSPDNLCRSRIHQASGQPVGAM